MSRVATNWAWKIHLKSSQKLLLLALADRADEHHCCYPSIQRLSNDTGLDRKTICRQINQMIADGLIIDTGKRKGATKQVKVLQLNIAKEEYQKRDSKGSQKRNSTEIGNDPKNGTQNLKVETNIESSKDNTQRFEENLKEKNCEYFFKGEVIRLSEKDFNTWQKIYPNLDLHNELLRLDIEYQHEKPKNWFITTSQKLNYQNRQFEKSSHAKPKRTSSFIADYSNVEYGDFELPEWAKGEVC